MDINSWQALSTSDGHMCCCRRRRRRCLRHHLRSMFVSAGQTIIFKRLRIIKNNYLNSSLNSQMRAFKVVQVRMNIHFIDFDQSILIESIWWIPMAFIASSSASYSLQMSISLFTTELWSFGKTNKFSSSFSSLVLCQWQLIQLSIRSVYC